MAFLFAETGMTSRFLLHHVRGHYPIDNFSVEIFGTSKRLSDSKTCWTRTLV